MNKDEFEALEQQAIEQSGKIERLEKELAETKTNWYKAENKAHEFEVAFQKLVKELMK